MRAITSHSIAQCTFRMEPITTMYVTQEALLGEVVELYPEAVPVIQEYGLHCVGCFASSFDTIEAGCKVHGMSDEIIDELIKKVNETIHLNKAQHINTVPQGAIL